MAARINLGNGTGPPTVDGRINHCMMLMRELRWKRGVTDQHVATAWGINLASVRQYSAEAWRRVKAEVTDHDAVAATVCVALERVIEEGSVKGLNGHRSVIEAAKAWAAIAGAGAPTRFEVGALANLSDVQLEERRLELIARLNESGGGKPTVIEVDAEDFEGEDVKFIEPPENALLVEPGEQDVANLNARQSAEARRDAETLDDLDKLDGDLPVGERKESGF